MARPAVEEACIRKNAGHRLIRSFFSGTFLRFAVRPLTFLLLSGIFLTLFFCAGLVLWQVQEMREHILFVASQKAQWTVHRIARDIARELNRRPSPSLPSASPSFTRVKDILETFALPLSADFSKTYQLVLTNRQEQIVVVWPEAQAEHVALSPEAIAHLTQPSLGEKSRPFFRNSVPYLMAAAPLGNALGHVYLLVPRADILGFWLHANLYANLFLSVFFLLLIGGGFFSTRYFRQRQRFKKLQGAMSARIDAALHLGQCGLWDWDLGRGRIYWSESMYVMLGIEAKTEFLSYGDICALSHPEDENLIEIAEKIVGGTLQRIDQTFRLRHALGHWVWVRIRAGLMQESLEMPAHLLGIALDITEQKVLAEHNATADRRLRDALEAISEAFILWDSEYRLVICNSKFQNLYPLPQELVRVGTPYAAMGLGDPPPHLPSERINLVEIGESARSYEAQFPDARWLQINERRTRDGGYVCVGTDITQLKQKEELLKDSERRLMTIISDLRRSRYALETQAQKLTELADKYLEQKAAAEVGNRTKAEFLANMSHEWRTPLNAIIGFSEMMAQETFGPLGNDKYKDYCAHIRESGQYLLSAISDVLDMARLEAGRVVLDRRYIPLDPILQKVLGDIEDLAKMKEIHVHKETLNGEYIYADPNALEQILSILLRNAVKFTPEHGVIGLAFKRSADSFALEVKDTGPGIAPDMIEKLGRPFEQSGETIENGMKGSGLGLAIARSLVELHGGNLSIHSIRRKGTTIAVHMPASSYGHSPQSLPEQEVHHAFPLKEAL